VTADLDTLLTALYVLIDDHVIPPAQQRPGRPKKLSDAEVVCLAVAQVLLGARSEHHWLRMCDARLGHLFPYLPKQPGYHKRVKAAAPLICRTTLYLASLCPSWTDDLRLLDATPVPCGMSRPTVRRSALVEVAGYGYCASHSRWYWGLKLYLLTTAEGMPVAWCLANPKIGEREVAQVLLAHARDLGALAPDMVVLADSGGRFQTASAVVYAARLGVVRAGGRARRVRHPRTHAIRASLADKHRAARVRRGNARLRVGGSPDSPAGEVGADQVGIAE
jgi:hypothetical protein